MKSFCDTRVKRSTDLDTGSRQKYSVFQRRIHRIQEELHLGRQTQWILFITERFLNLLNVNEWFGKIHWINQLFTGCENFQIPISNSDFGTLRVECERVCPESPGPAPPPPPPPLCGISAIENEWVKFWPTECKKNVVYDRKIHWFEHGLAQRLEEAWISVRTEWLTDLNIKASMKGISLLLSFLLPVDVSTEEGNQSSGVLERCRGRTERKFWIWRWLSAVDQRLHTKLLWYQEPKRCLLSSCPFFTFMFSLFHSVEHAARFLQVFFLFVHGIYPFIYSFTYSFIHSLIQLLSSCFAFCLNLTPICITSTWAKQTTFCRFTPKGMTLGKLCQYKIVPKIVFVKAACGFFHWGKWSFRRATL